MTTEQDLKAAEEFSRLPVSYSATPLEYHQIRGRYDGFLAGIRHERVRMKLTPTEAMTIDRLTRVDEDGLELFAIEALELLAIIKRLTGEQG